MKAGSASEPGGPEHPYAGGMFVPQPCEVVDLAGVFALPAVATYSLDQGDFSPTLLAGQMVARVINTLERVLGVRRSLEAHTATIRFRKDVALHSSGGPCGGYRLCVKPEGITIDAADATGVLYAVETLVQILKTHGSCLPAQRVSDAPAFAVRGVMLDVSRNRIPTMAEFERILDTLCSLKFNHLQLYTEHTFAYAGHEEVWRGFSPLTPDEIRRLDESCAQRGIALVANQNCFGHLVPWLSKPRYAHLAETHGDWMFDLWPRSGAFSLCPTDPASLTFIEGLLDELLPCFTQPMVNIGCDEVYDIAYGRSKHEVDKIGRPAVYMRFVNQVVQACRQRGRTAQFWADIALSYPGCLADIPSDVTSLAWGYEADSPFEQWGERLKGRPFWVCPGTSSWRSLTGRTQERCGNIEVAARAGLQYAASGFLVCDWGDSGHHQQWPITLNALAQASQAAWNPAATVNLAAVSLHCFDDPTLLVASWLNELGDADLPLRETCGPLSHPTRKRLLNQTAIFIDMFKRWDEQQEVGSIAAWFESLDRIAALGEGRPAVANTLLKDELAHTASYALFSAGRGAMRRDSAAATHAPVHSRLHDQLDAIRSDHRRLWLARSRSGGLVQSESYFDTIRGNIPGSRPVAVEPRGSPTPNLATPGSTHFQ